MRDLFDAEATQFFFGETQHLAVGAVDLEELAVGAVEGNRHGSELEKRAKFFLAFAQHNFCAMALGNILVGAFVIEQGAGGILDSASVDTDPKGAAIFAVTFSLETDNGWLGFQEVFELLPFLRQDISLALDIGDVGDQFFRRVIPKHTRECWISAEVAARGRGAENTFSGIFKDAAVFGFGFAQSLSDFDAAESITAKISEGLQEHQIVVGIRLGSIALNGEETDDGAAGANGNAQERS